MVFGLLEKDVLCATMAVTTTMGVDLGFSWVFLGVFPFDFLSYSCYSKKNNTNFLDAHGQLRAPDLHPRKSLRDLRNRIFYEEFDVISL